MIGLEDVEQNVECSQVVCRKNGLVNLIINRAGYLFAYTGSIVTIWTWSVHKITLRKGLYDIHGRNEGASRLTRKEILKLPHLSSSNIGKQ